jgi:hypothetical protein
MPRIAGVNIVAWLAAAIAMFFVGFVIYGLLFQQAWQGELLAYLNLADSAEGGAAMDMNQAQQLIAGGKDPTLNMALGGVISLVTALGLALLIRMVKPASLGGALGVGFVAWFGFAATTLAYDPVYAYASTTIFGIDLVHTLINYLLASAIIFLIDSKAISGAAAPAAA